MKINENQLGPMLMILVGISCFSFSFSFSISASFNLTLQSANFRKTLRYSANLLLIATLKSMKINKINENK